ncbi:alpha/beta hydrolase [Conexibacter sp. SYSU D00693]|uniref:alpha/beta hydrolase n=1 Tax=Conexibacter sp. SYSU D00693 TaxID=2812560 RepID=UPI00196B9E06|nr:alpha/beta hydrolase [Conexibacter sp. SYSU D00693]
MSLGLPPALVREQMRLAAKWMFSPTATWQQSRKRLDLLTRFPPPPPGTDVAPSTVGGVPVEWVTPKGGGGARRVLLYLHGGGYAVGSARSMRRPVALTAGAMGARACVVDYRLAPEHPHPAALEDARAVWDALLADGADPKAIAVAGDSAGANLSLVLALSLREAGQPLPGALGLICPWLDLTQEWVATRSDAPREPILTPDLIRRFTEATCAGGADPADPLVSPLRADLAGLPPMVVHSGADDLLVNDAAELERRARTAGVHVEHRRYDGLWHDFQLSSAFLSGAGRDASAAMGRMLARHLA